MDPRIVPDLLVFRAVAEQGSITRAARQLHTVQSNVTARIKKLEGEFGQPLFHRHARGVKVTPAGERLLPLVMKLDALLVEIRSNVGADPLSIHGSLRIGSIETVAALQLTPLLAKFGAAYPGIDVSLQTGSSVDLITRLKALEIDIAFASGPLLVSGIEQELIFEDQLCVAAPAGIGSFESISRPTSRGLKILFQRPDCSYTRRLESHLKDIGTVLSRGMQLGALDAILSCVQAGIGIAALPQSMIEHSGLRDLISVIPFPETKRSITTYLVQRKPRTKSAAIDLFCTFLSRERASARRL
jgi:DNA-binding transcriptional LysR family regulator